MSRNYDNWERLVAAVLKKQQFLELCHAHSRSPSVLSDASSDFSSISFNSSPYNNLLQGRLEKRKDRGLVLVPDYRPILHHDDLLVASSVEALGKGTFTSVSRYEFDDLAAGFVVKRLNNTVMISEQDFKKHMRIVGDVEHENVDALRAYHYSNNEKFMICAYYSVGSVSELLHGKPGTADVDWKDRLNIAIGAARGICHIHAQNDGKMVHGNIKSSNIFLNSHRYGLVSDLGLASMVPTTFPLSSRCYAPEVKSTSDISQESDVYSFGILLLELLTRKSPHPSRGEEAVDLVQLVNFGWTFKVLDGDLLLIPSAREQIVRMVQIGLSCTKKSPKKRPKMSETAKMIEEISTMKLETGRTWVTFEIIRCAMLFLMVLSHLLKYLLHSTMKLETGRTRLTFAIIRCAVVFLMILGYLLPMYLQLSTMKLLTGRTTLTFAIIQRALASLLILSNLLQYLDLLHKILSTT